MKKSIFLLHFFALIILNIKAQTQKKQSNNNEGVNFLHNVTNWNLILEQAKKEKKFIFLDCYTTWCTPCKKMDREVFPLKKVGDYLNPKAICIGLQMDEKAYDTKETIESRKVAKQINERYKIASYPTFIIIDTNNNLVNRFDGGSNVEHFLERLKLTFLNLSKKTLKQLEEEYGAGNREKAFIEEILTAAINENKNIDNYVEDFVKTRDSLFTEKNKDILKKAYTYTGFEGKAFKILIDDKEKWSTVKGSEELYAIIELKISFQIHDYVDAIKEKKEKVNWDELKTRLVKKYADIGFIVYYKVKLSSFADEKNWKGYEETINQLCIEDSSFYKDDTNWTNDICRSICDNISDKNITNKALEWIAYVNNQPWLHSVYIDTYAHLLYKVGKKDEAIIKEQKAFDYESDVEKKKAYKKTLNEMKTGVSVLSK